MNRAIFIVGLAMMLLFAPACLENLFSTDEEELNQDLIGVWYRFTITEDGVIYGFPALVKLLEDGSGTIESLNEPDQEEADFDAFKWVTDGSAITITDENDSTIWAGTFVFSDNNNVVRSTYSLEGHAYEEVYVRYTGERNSEFTGTWIMVNNLTGTETSLTVERVVFSSDGTGADYRIDDLEDSTGDSLEVTTDIFTWNTSGNYLAVFDEGEHLPMVIQYAINNDVFTGLAYDDEGLTEDFTLVKDAGDIDPDGVGVWTLSTMTINEYKDPIAGLAITLNLNDDGTGTWTITTLMGSESYSFNWKTNGGYVFIYKDTMPEVAWVQEYQISGNTLILKTDTEYYEGYGWVTAEYTFTRSS